MAQTAQQAPFHLLHRHHYANLTTFRKSGEAIQTPVWFAERDGRIYIMTPMGSGKAKRVRNNGKVLIGPADISGRPLGATIEAQARLLSDAEEIKIAYHALDEKYGLFKAVIDFIGTVSGIERAYIEVTVAE